MKKMITKEEFMRRHVQLSKELEEMKKRIDENLKFIRDVNKSIEELIEHTGDFIKRTKETEERIKETEICVKERGKSIEKAILENAEKWRSIQQLKQLQLEQAIYPTNPGEVEKQKVGKVFTYWSKIGVAGIQITDGFIEVGDTILIQGHTTNFEQKVESIQIEKAPVQRAQKGQSVGIKVKEKVRSNDVVYKLVAV